MAEYIDRGIAIAKLTALEIREPHATLTDAKWLLADMPAVSVPQWISVKDRPPEDNDRVLVFRPNEAEVSAYRYSVMWGWALKTPVSHSGITHWMPLPEPPKGDADNG